MTAPGRTLEQRRAALRHANAIRSARKALKAELKGRGVLALVELLRDPDRVAGELVEQAPAGYVDTMHVADALTATRGIGTVKAGRFLRAVKVSPSRTLAGLSDRQRRELADAVAPMRRLRSAQPVTTTEARVA